MSRHCIAHGYCREVSLLVFLRFFGGWVGGGGGWHKASVFGVCVDRTQVNKRSTYARPGMHMQQCSAVFGGGGGCIGPKPLI